MSRTRTSFEQGHQRKLLVLIDDTMECDRAVYYAARRAKRTNGQLVLLHILGQNSNETQWLQVEAMMRAEAQEDAEVLLSGWTEKLEINFGLEAEQVIREGDPFEQITSLLDEDEDIAIIILAASSGPEGPGVLISNLSSLMGGEAPVPITIVPDSLSDMDIDALA